MKSILFCCMIVVLFGCASKSNRKNTAVKLFEDVSIVANLNKEFLDELKEIENVPTKEELLKLHAKYPDSHFSIDENGEKREKTIKAFI